LATRLQCRARALLSQAGRGPGFGAVVRGAARDPGFGHAAAVDRERAIAADHGRRRGHDRIAADLPGAAIGGFIAFASHGAE